MPRPLRQSWPACSSTSSLNLVAAPSARILRSLNTWRYVVPGAAAVAVTNTSDQPLQLQIEWPLLGVESAIGIVEHSLGGQVIVHPTASSGMYDIEPYRVILLVCESEFETESKDLATP